MRAAVFACLAFAAAVQEDPAEALVRKLGSDLIDERAAAVRALNDLGEAARPALTKASKVSDLEVSRRAAVLLRVLDLRGRFSPALRELLPNVEERLCDGGDAEWTAVFLQAIRGGAPTADLAVLAPAAVRGARTQEDVYAVCECVRARAIREALPDLLKILERDDPNISRAPLRCLPALDGPELRRGLLAILGGSRRTPARLMACEVLLDVDARDALPSMIKLLADPAPELRRKGLAVLVRFEAKDRAASVVALLRDPDAGVREEAVLTLRRLDAREAVPAATALLADPAAATRQAAARALDVLKAADAVPALAERLADEDAGVRAAAAWALGTLGGADRAPRLTLLLKDEDSSVRAGAVWALTRGRIAGAAPEILPLLKDEDSDVRTLAAWAVGELDAREAAPRLIGTLADPVIDVRRSAARAAGRLRLKEAVPALLKQVESQHIREREDAVRALGKIGAPEAIPILLAAEPADKKGIDRAALRPGAFEALRAYPAVDVLPRALALLEDKDRSRRPAAAEALRAIRAPAAKDVLLKLLADPLDEVQASAARALGEMGAREAIPRLVEILEDESSDARAAAGYALSLLGAAEALPALRRGAQEPDRDTEGEFVRALERFGDEVSRDFVVAGLPEYRDEGIAAAAMWLCREGRKVAIRPLLDDDEIFTPLNALRHPEPWKRLHATRLPGDLEGSLPELAEKIGAAAGVTVDFQASSLEPDIDLLLSVRRIDNPDGRLSAAEALLALVRLTEEDYEAFVEPGRIRIVPWDEAEDFWNRWGERALKEK